MNLKNFSLSAVVITLLCHSICCIFPFVFVLLGLNTTFHFGYDFFHEYSHYFLIANIIFIAINFYVVFIHKKKKNCKHAECGKTGKTQFFLILVFTLGMIYYNYFVEHRHQVNVEDVIKSLEESKQQVSI